MSNIFQKPQELLDTTTEISISTAEDILENLLEPQQFCLTAAVFLFVSCLSLQGFPLTPCVRGL